jgi:hypothetical protein
MQTSLLLRLFALLAAFAAAGIAAAEARSAVYQQIAARIWQNDPYSPSLVLGALNETTKFSPAFACATGTADNRAALALRALDDAFEGHSDLTVAAGLPIAAEAVDDGLACRPLAAQLWLARFYVRALSEGFRPPLRQSYDRAIVTAPYDGWIMLLRTQVGSRWFYALDEAEQKKFFEDLRYTVDMGFLDDAYRAVKLLGNRQDQLRREINQWPLSTRDRFASYLLTNGVDLKLTTDFELKPWQHY